MSGARKGDTRGSRRRTVEGDEARLWQEVMRDVTPLSGRRVSIPEERPSAQRPEPEAPARPAQAASQAASAPRPAGELPELGPGVAPGVDKRTLLRLHRGQLEIEARIDLHGLTQEEAWRALHAFLDGSRKADRRSVLVVTGKGKTQDGALGVLRAAVPRWLNQPENRALVLAFCPARPKDGGAGALYVLLKRRR